MRRFLSNYFDLLFYSLPETGTVPEKFGRHYQTACQTRQKTGTGFLVAVFSADFCSGMWVIGISDRYLASRRGVVLMACICCVFVRYRHYMKTVAAIVIKLSENERATAVGSGWQHSAMWRHVLRILFVRLTRPL